jgi:hypothetical protein
MSQHPLPITSKKGVSTRCFVEYEIDLGGSELKLQTPVLFKRILRVGTKFIVVAEILGNPVAEYSLQILQVASMNYIPLSAKYIDSIVLADSTLVHFFAQPKGASTDTSAPVSELAAAQVRRPTSPPREEDLVRQSKSNLREQVKNDKE